MTWIAAIVAFVLTLAAPLLAIAAVTDDPPEVRVLQTDGRVSAMIADGPLRVLVLNSTDPRMARSTLGAARPWEPRPQLVIAPSDDDAAIGLLEVVRAARPQAVVVAGIPGASRIWHAVERECRDSGINLAFTAAAMHVKGDLLNLTILGTEFDEGDGRAVVVRRADGGATVTIALDRGLPKVRSHALVTSSAVENATTELVITTADEPRRLTQPEVALGFRESARIILNRDEIEVFGGISRGPSDND